MTLRARFIPDRAIALFLDVDGTLLELAASPDAVRVPAALRNTLELAARHEQGALALVSGRSIEKLDHLFAPSVFPAAGQHGAERRDIRGNLWHVPVDRQLLQPAREQLHAWVQLRPGTLLEDKGAALALHYRQAPHLEAFAHAVVQQMAASLAPHFHLKEGKYVRELVPTAASKRLAIESFMGEEPFASRTPVFVGDDVTDEEGFRAVNALGGHSIRVGRAAAPTEAQHRFASVSGVVAWLRERNTRIPRRHALRGH